MQIKLWGVRGSIPAPLSPPQLEEKMVDLLVAASGKNTSTPSAARAFLRSLPMLQGATAGGNTPCVEIEAEGHRLIIDAGSGIKELGRKLMDGPCASGQAELDILVSHTHWDHIVGLPFFSPAFIPGNKLTFWGCHPHLKQRFAKQHHPYNFPVPLESIPAEIQFRKLTPGKKKKLGAFTVTPFQLVHPGTSYAYRIEHGGYTFVYASDASYNDLTPQHMEKYHEFYRNADALVFDAHFALIESFEKSDWGHSSSFIGVDIALHAGVKRLILFHHDHLSDDKRLQNIFQSTQNYLRHVAPNSTCEILLGHEGMELNLDG